MAEYDTSHWPLAYLRLPADASTLAIEPMERSLERIFARRERFVSVTDASAVTRMPSAKWRSDVAAWTKRIEPLSQRWVLATSMVITSPIARGVLTAIQWVSPPVVPMASFSTLEEAVEFVARHAGQGGLDRAPLDRFVASHRS